MLFWSPPAPGPAEDARAACAACRGLRQAQDAGGRSADGIVRAAIAQEGHGRAISAGATSTKAPVAAHRRS